MNKSRHKPLMPVSDAHHLSNNFYASMPSKSSYIETSSAVLSVAQAATTLSKASFYSSLIII